MTQKMPKNKDEEITQNDNNSEKAKKVVSPREAAEYNAKLGFRWSIAILVSVSLGYLVYSWSIYYIFELILMWLLILCIYKKSMKACIWMLIYYLSCTIATIFDYGSTIWIIGILIIICLIQWIRGCKYLQDNNIVKEKKWEKVLSIILIAIASFALAINIQNLILEQLLLQLLW